MVSCWRPHGFPKEKSQELLSARVAKRAEDSLRTSKVGLGVGGGGSRMTRSRFQNASKERKEGGFLENLFELIWIVE